MIFFRTFVGRRETAAGLGGESLDHNRAMAPAPVAPLRPPRYGAAHNVSQWQESA